MHNIKKELLEKIKYHREEYLNIFNESEEQKQRAEKIKSDKFESDVNNTKRILSLFDRKIETESELRLKNEEDLRQYFESKFINMHEQLKTDEKLALEREQRMMA